MTEIYRAWDAMSSEMYYSDKEYETSDGLIVWNLDHRGITLSIPGVEDTMPGGIYHEQKIVYRDFEASEALIFMQALNITDKNNKRIFQDDLVRYTYLPGEGYWNFDGLLLVNIEGSGVHLKTIVNYNPQKCLSLNSYACSVPGLHESELWEVIGNIHANPELLEAK